MNNVEVNDMYFLCKIHRQNYMKCINFIFPHAMGSPKLRVGCYILSMPSIFPKVDIADIDYPWDWMYKLEDIVTYIEEDAKCYQFSMKNRLYDAQYEPLHSDLFHSLPLEDQHFFQWLESSFSHSSANNKKDHFTHPVHNQIYQTCLAILDNEDDM
ncbi:DUF2538 family protein [Bacillus coahuilensis]|nr:DUF2538 family protein [Bacillus coahuilensis]